NGLKPIGRDRFVLSGRNILGLYDVQKNTWTDYYTAVETQLSPSLFSDLYLFFESIDDQQAWLGIESCLYRFALPQQKVTQSRCFPSPITRMLAEAKAFWVGTTTGLYHCRDTQCLAEPTLAGLMIKDLRRDEQGRLWVATSAGLYCYGDRLVVLNQNNGLRSNYVYGSLSDQQGQVWVSTNQGLSKIDPTNWTVRNYDREDGISATEFNSYGFWKSAADQLYFSGIGGITRVDPAVDEGLEEAIPLVISAWSINDRLPQALAPQPTDLVLGPQENTLTFYFRDLLLPPQGNLRFSYQLAGFEDHWVQTDQLAVRYPQLPPGDYTFRLKLANDAPAVAQALHFRIASPFYQQTWFVVLMMAVLTFFLWGMTFFYRRRQQRRLRIQGERQAALERERKRISRELHDNMGAHTTALISNIQQLQASETTAAHREQLAYMQRDAQDILSSLRDTIWLLNDKQMYLTELIDLVKIFALRLIGNPGNYNLVVNEKVENDVLLKAAQVVHLKAMLQEIIHNTVKHAEGDCIVFNITTHPKRIDIVLSDNGKGFDLAAQKRGHGLNNLYWRAEEMKVKLDVQSDNNGTVYQLRCPIHSLMS
ncbi:MAG: histidine kinase, partial [Bacteroidota bacterium]